MGKALWERYTAPARVFVEAEAAVRSELRTLCFDGPQDLLDRTDNAQPALLTTSIAALRAAEEALGHALPQPLACAGHSLGEYTAIVAAGALSVTDAVRLVRRRGELMHAAAPDGGGMAAVIGLDASTIERAIDRTGVVIANDNAPGQVVISGPLAAFDAVTTRRPWREGYTADEAMKIMIKESGTKFDPVIVKVLVNLMGLYPLGSGVLLDSGELALVYHNSNDPKLFTKPFVKVVRDAQGQRVKKTVIRNLAEHEGAGGEIVSIAKPSDLEGLDPGMAIVF
jgi:malonyl CoA-acyl carrier protein transacylase